VIRVVNVVGARPNFMKVAPIHRAMRDAGGFEPFLVHTGQHYDKGMSGVFFDELGLPEPDLSLGVGSGSHAEQTAGVMVALEPVLDERRPDVVVVVGDVNSTMGAALTAVKLHIAVAHVEAGLRSFDRTMPEEINRIVTDVVSTLLFAPSDDAVANLRSEGIPGDKVHLVGNVMIDSLEALLPEARKSDILDRLGLAAEGYFLATLHRPSNVDRPETLARVADLLAIAARARPVLLAAHPRTAKRLDDAGLSDAIGSNGVRVIEPLSYIDFLQVMACAVGVMTDSGGIQEETTVLGVPCLTLRDQTERPITVTEGTNRIVGLDPARFAAGIAAITAGQDRTPRRPKLWDGHTAERIVAVLEREFGV
jgi:UDP-N-acetylglucosamine 2-epimerase (non-hydrolysing)